jgi:hypothetical protein
VKVRELLYFREVRKYEDFERRGHRGTDEEFEEGGY